MELDDLKAMIRDARINRGISQMELSRISGVPRSRIAIMENPDNFESFNITTLLPILSALDMKIGISPCNGGRPVFEDIIAEKEEEESHVPGLG